MMPIQVPRMKYHSRLEIMTSVLNAAKNGATKTRIMYGAFLSYAQLKEYLKFCEMKGLLACEQGTQLYKLTPKGLEFLKLQAEMSKIIET
jgi:predicted transcriptional regulator